MKINVFDRSAGLAPRPSPRRFLTAVAGVLVLSAAGAALAQSAPDGPPQDLSRLHDALRLSPAQEAAWKAYAAALAPDPVVEARRRSATTMMKTLPTPRRVDLINAEMEAEMVAMRRQGEAVKAFYAQLSPEQQKTFDQMTFQPPEDGEGQ